MVNTVSGATSYPVQIEASPINIAQCVREVYSLLLSSLRDRDRTIQIWRDIESRSHDELTNEKVRSLRNPVPQIMRIAAVVLGGISVCGGLFPEAIKHSYEWLHNKCPILPTGFLEEMFGTGKTDGYSKLSKVFTGSVSNMRDMVKMGIDLHATNEKAYQDELDALIEKSKKAEDRRKEESSERQSASSETHRLLQQIDNHIAEAIRALAR
jgi:hypothetical protein